MPITVLRHPVDATGQQPQTIYPKLPGRIISFKIQSDGTNTFQTDTALLTVPPGATWHLLSMWTCMPQANILQFADSLAATPGSITAIEQYWATNLTPNQPWTDRQTQGVLPFSFTRRFWLRDTTAGQYHISFVEEPAATPLHLGLT